MATKQQTVYIVDDDPEWCESLRWLLETVNIQSQIFQDGRAFLDSHDNSWAGCLLLDIRMPGISGLQVLEQLNERGSQMPIIIISGHADVPLAIRAMKAGAFDLITKPINEEQLLEQIYKALDHNKQLQAAPNRTALSKRFASLTAREREVLEHAIAGKLNKQIAAELNISIKTVELHRSHLLQKIQAKNFTEVMRLYFLAHNP